MDPETGFDQVSNVVFEDGIITVISTGSVSVTRIIDATGLVLAPGFIDLRAHGQDTVSNQFQVADGVTTTLELEIGVYPVSPWYAARENTAPTNYGTSAGHPWARGYTYVPSMKKKGRLQVGADADITLFDPKTIIDRATYTKPAQYSAGIEYVFVNGIAVIDHGVLIDNIFPGKPIRVGVH